MRQTMTLLQRSVIQQLRDAAMPALAELARSHWSLGEGIPGGVDVPTRDLPRHHELAVDLARADEQATRPSS